MAVVGVRNVLVETLKTERNDGKKYVWVSTRR